VPTRPEDNEEERLARVAEIMRQNGIRHDDLEAYVARVRRQAAHARTKALKRWPSPKPAKRK